MTTTPTNPTPAAQHATTEPTPAERSRGYVEFGAGLYRMQVCSDASLIVSFRREGEQHYAVGDRAAEVDPTPIQPEDMIVWLKFLSAAALDSVEAHLREIRQEHWPESVAAPAAQAASPKPLNEEVLVSHIQIALTAAYRSRGNAPDQDFIESYARDVIREARKFS